MSDDFDDLFDDDDNDDSISESLVTADHDTSGATGALTLDAASLDLTVTSPRYGGDPELRLRGQLTNHTGRPISLVSVQLVQRTEDRSLLDSETIWSDVKFVDRQELLHDLRLESGVLPRLGAMDLWVEWEATFKCPIASATVPGVSTRRGDGDAHEEPWPAELATPSEPDAWLPRFEVHGLRGFHGRQYDDVRARWLLELSESPGSLSHHREIVLALRDADGKVLKKQQEDMDLAGTSRVIKFDFYDISAHALKRARGLDVVAKADVRRREKLSSFTIGRGAYN